MVVKTLLPQRLKKSFASVSLNSCIVQSIELLLLVSASFWKLLFSSENYCSLSIFWTKVFFYVMAAFKDCFTDPLSS